MTPFLKNIHTVQTDKTPNRYPFTIPAFSKGINIDFTSCVTMFVGENGSGKSTILEAIADGCNFSLGGGNRNHVYSRHQTESDLATALRFSWMPKVTNGFFMRAESFFNFATYIDEIAEDDPSVLQAYGGKSLHEQSHGESFLSLFLHRFDKGIFILDEPEAALSPARQLSFLAILHEMESRGNAQFIIATHSPILLSYPGAVLYSLDGEAIRQVDYRETDQFLLTKDFLNDPERFYKHLFAE